MRFSLSTQSFYDSDLEYGDNLPSDVAEITEEQYVMLLTGINSQKVAYLVDGEYILSPEKPDAYHTWDSSSLAWVISDEMKVKKSADTIDNNERIKTTKMSSGQSQVNPLQYAVDLSIATDDEVTKLKEWKIYLVELNRVDTTQENIEWPSEPIF